MPSNKELSIGEKLKVIKERETVSISERELARKFGISKSQVHRILKNKEKIRQLSKKTFCKRKRARRMYFPNSIHI